MIQPVDSSILHEIARVVNARSKVPDRVHIRGKDYQLTYLDDHKQRIEDALRRHDPDKLNMLYGQLASKVKYQLLRQVSTRQGGQATGKGAASAGKRRPGARGAPGTRVARPVKGKTAAAKAKSQPAKKRRESAKKPTVGKKPTGSRAARR